MSKRKGVHFRKLMAVVIFIATMGIAVLGVREETRAADLPVMMSDNIEGAEAGMRVVFGTDVLRSSVKTITFYDTLDNALTGAFDISESQDNSVLAWMTENSESASDNVYYDLHIAGQGGVKAPKDCGYLFSEYKNVTSIEFRGCFDTSEVTDMESMFSGCSNVRELDVSNFDTSQVINMMSMFGFCSNITELDVSHFDTSEVTDMGGMFGGCSNVTELDVSNFDTSQVINMGYMFYDCSSLTELDVSHFDTSQVTNMRAMFSDCSNITEVDVSHFDTSQVTDMIRMFVNCSNVRELDVSHFDTLQVTDMSYMFMNCSNVTEMDVSNFDTSRVVFIDSMFKGCSSLTELDVSNFNILAAQKNYTDQIERMFDECTSLTELKEPKNPAVMKSDNIEEFMGTSAEQLETVTVFGTDILRNSIKTITFCDTLSDVPENAFDISEVQDGSVMAWVTPNGNLYDMYIAAEGYVVAPEECRLMFACYNNLISIEFGDVFRTSQTDDMAGMFYGCSNLTELDVSGFFTYYVSNMNSMFALCSKLSQIDVSNFYDLNINYMGYMFAGCTSLTDLEIRFAPWQIQSAEYMFKDCSQLSRSTLESKVYIRSGADTTGMYEGTME